MKTPIFDFINKYTSSNPMRLHMPGHKGIPRCGFEDRDITEINGADSLYEAHGIIAESESNVSMLYGCPTYYSTEGSSLSIRAMLYLTCVYAAEKGEKAVIFAGRNCHKSFLYAASMLDFDVKWLCPATPSYLSCPLTAQDIEKAIGEADVTPTAVYLTSPDYLGNTIEIAEIASVCKKHGVLLLVDNAHGAYLKFLPENRHPIDLGATVCCDSAHKTLPVLTGGGYLHVANDAPEVFKNGVKEAMSVFGSTSPSYLILESLDLANKYIADGYSNKLSETACEIATLKAKLEQNGFKLCGNEPLKLTVRAKEYGYSGIELCELLEEKNIFCEFADNDFTVMMFTPDISANQLKTLFEVMTAIPEKQPKTEKTPEFFSPKKVMSIREAVMSVSETLPASECDGRILALPNCSCPPAVQIVSCGELIDKNAINAFDYYGIKTCRVVKTQI